MQIVERRLENRFLCAELVRISWSVGAGLAAVEAVLEDISEEGACVQVDEELPVGMEVKLSAGPACLKGIVSYCHWRDYGYFAGIRLADDTHWSSGVFMPQHLTNIRALGGN